MEALPSFEGQMAGRFWRPAQVSCGLVKALGVELKIHPTAGHAPRP